MSINLKISSFHWAQFLFLFSLLSFLLVGLQLPKKSPTNSVKDVYSLTDAPCVLKYRGLSSRPSKNGKHVLEWLHHNIISAHKLHRIICSVRFLYVLSSDILLQLLSFKVNHLAMFIGFVSLLIIPIVMAFFGASVTLQSSGKFYLKRYQKF